MIEIHKKNNSGNEVSYLDLSALSIFATIDLAITINQQSDFTDAIIFSTTSERKVFIFEVIREKFETADHINFVQNIFTKWRPILLGIESVQYQVALDQQARRLGIPIKALRAGRDKVARSLSIATFLNSDMIYLNRKGA